MVKGFAQPIPRKAMYMRWKRASKKIRKSYVFSTLVLAAALMAPWVQALAFPAEERTDLERLKAGIVALAPQTDLHWREELAHKVVAEAEKLQLPDGTKILGREVNKPAFLLSQIWVESQFVPTARSHSNAQGLMQVKPTTAHVMIKELQMPRKWTYYGVDENLTLGVRYMNILLGMFQDLEKATFAYNIGPGAFARGKKNQFYWDKIIDAYRYIMQYRQHPADP